jgi:T4 RnlA family RNA ligase
MMNLDMELLAKHVKNGVVKAQRHPSLPLTIHNYSQRCQFEKLWDDVSLQCRGLVLDDSGNVVARPFPKFFNLDEQGAGLEWNFPFTVSEKVDGSLLIAFWFQDRWVFASRGSFTSEQAVRGEEIFRRKYDINDLEERFTYCFEVIYPENRIVVDYKDTEDVILLGVIETATGTDLNVRHCWGSLRVVKTVDWRGSIYDLRNVIKDDEEGYVVRFFDGRRVKVKGRRYMELHKIISGISTRSVWEAASSGNLDDFLNLVPDECMGWVRGELEKLSGRFQDVFHKAIQAANAVANLDSRKEKALALMKDHPDVARFAFLLLDGKQKSLATAIWKSIEPAFEKPKSVERIE